MVKNNEKNTDVKTIGILTFHCAKNFGAVLQALALQLHLSHQGYKVGIINYKPEFLTLQYKTFQIHRFLRINLLKSLLEMLLLIPRYIRNKNFDEFFNTSYSYIDINSINTLDTVIVGSDQVWNIRKTKGFDQYYWGDFQCNNKVTYAASMDINNLTLDQIKGIENRIHNFNSVSVRESYLKEKIQSLSEKKIYQVLDPTFLLKKEDWVTLNNYDIKKKYLFVYEARSSKKTHKIAEKIAKDRSLDIIYLSPQLSNANSINLYGIKPLDFIGLINNADMVVTSSFHGTALSIILNTPFYSIFLNDGADSRVTSLLQSVNLESRLLGEYITPSCMIDWENINIKIDQLRMEAVDYLKNTL